MIKRFPAVFSFDLETHIRPRAEFLRALGVDPLTNGLVYLITASIADLAQSAGVTSRVFTEFNIAYLDMWKRRGRRDEPQAVTAPLRSFPINQNDETRKFSGSVDVVIDELDFGF